MIKKTTFIKIHKSEKQTYFSTSIKNLYICTAEKNGYHDNILIINVLHFLYNE